MTFAGVSLVEIRGRARSDCTYVLSDLALQNRCKVANDKIRITTIFGNRRGFGQ